MEYTVKDIVERDIITVLPDNIKACFTQIPEHYWNKTYEIRLRAGQKPSLSMANGEVNIDELHGAKQVSLIISQEDIAKILGIMSQNSLYAIQEEIRAGFLTLKGGHRVGLAGKVISCSNSVQNLKYFSSLNIRIARQIPGSASKLLECLIGREGFINTLIISPPRCGKTTMLRDIIRQLSNGIPSMNTPGYTVGVVDERSEIAACYKGIPQNDVGIRTDVLDNCPKAEGIMMLVRSMGPNIIATDEIGSKDDAKAIMTALSAGIGVVTTAHGCSIEDIMLREGIRELITSRAFGRIVVLGKKENPGYIRTIYDGFNLKPVAQAV